MFNYLKKINTKLKGTNWENICISYVRVKNFHYSKEELYNTSMGKGHEQGIHKRINYRALNIKCSTSEVIKMQTKTMPFFT